MIRVLRHYFFCTLTATVMASSLASAASDTGGARPSLKLFGNSSQVLPVEQAFVFEAAALDADTALVRFTIAPGTYLYRDKLKFALAGDAASLGPVQLPAGSVHNDEFFGDTRVFRTVVEINLPVHRFPGTDRITLMLSWQGCADIGVCYPPQRARTVLDFTGLKP